MRSVEGTEAAVMVAWITTVGNFAAVPPTTSSVLVGVVWLFEVRTR